MDEHSEANNNVQLVPSSNTMQRTRMMISELKKILERQDVKLIRFAKTEIQLTYGLKDLGKLATAANPTKATVVISSVMIQKVMAAAATTTDSQRVQCASAVASLAGDLTAAAILAPETLGFGSIIPLFGAALDSYHMANACFVVNGKTSHALSAR